MKPAASEGKAAEKSRAALSQNVTVQNCFALTSATCERFSMGPI